MPNRPGLVSVIIPARNAADTLGQQLDALSGQTYQGPAEVVIVLNKCTDNTEAVAREYAGRIEQLRITSTEVEGIASVRAFGVSVARGDLLAFCDADDVVGRDWLGALVTCALGADLVAGSLEPYLLNDSAALSLRGPLPPSDAPLRPLAFLPAAPAGNCAIWRGVLDAAGGWRPEFGRANEDIELSWRVQLSGFRFAFCPEAVVHYRYRTNAFGVMRQYFWYGVTEQQLRAAFRRPGLEGPQILLPSRRLLAAAARLVLNAMSNERRKAAAGAIAFEVGHLVGWIRAAFGSWPGAVGN